MFLKKVGVIFMFAVMTIGCLLCITALSFLLSGEIFSHSIKKSARKKMLGINLVVTVLFFVLYPARGEKGGRGLLCGGARRRTYARGRRKIRRRGVRPMRQGLPHFGHLRRRAA